MSNKLAKVLVICALVVVLPLFVAGTVIAVYNSLNSTINVEVYTGEKEEGRTYPQEPTITSDAGITQVDNEGVISYQVTNGLNKQTNIEYSSVGYNFVGWFNGTRAEYVQALGDLQDGEQITYIQEIPNQVLTVNQGDYSNITAVFEVISYNFDFYYQQTPNGEYVTTAPNGKAEYIYGEQLPTFADTDTHDFLGWAIYDENAQTIVGAPSKVANFATTDGLTLTTVWEEVKTYRVEYYGDDGMLDNDNDTFTTRNYQDYQLQIPDARVGYTATWQDASGNVITSITQEMLEENEASTTIRLYLTYSANTYSASFTGANGATFTGGSRTATFTIENTAELSKFDVDSNWSHSDGYSYTVGSYSYNGNSYTTIDALVQAIATRNPQSQVSVQVNFSRVTETFTVNYYDGTSLAGTKRFSETSIPTIALTDYEEENLGYDIEYIYNGRVVNAITSQMLNENRSSYTLRIEIRKTAHEFTANFTATDATFEGGSNNVTFTVNSLDQLNRYAEADNWTHTDYIWNLTNFTYNSNTYDNLTDLANAIMQDKPTNTVSVQVNFERVVTEYTISYRENSSEIHTYRFNDDTMPNIAQSSLNRDGYNISYSYNGTSATIVTSEMLRENRSTRTIIIDVNYSIINTTVNISNANLYGYQGSTSINVNANNYTSTLGTLLSDSNWERYSHVYDFQGISYGGRTYNSVSLLWGAICGRSSVTVSPVVDELVSTLVLTNGIAYEDGVQNAGGDLQDDATRKEYTMSTTIIGDILDPNDTYQLNGDAVSPSQIEWNNGLSRIPVDLATLNGNTIAALVDHILSTDKDVVNNSGTVEIESITIYFA
mgnify:CR=1 FL=1